MEDIVQTSISTGPRGALRMAQGIQAFIGVGGEWLTEASKVTGTFFHCDAFFFFIAKAVFTRVNQFVIVFCI